MSGTDKTPDPKILWDDHHFYGFYIEPDLSFVGGYEAWYPLDQKWRFYERDTYALSPSVGGALLRLIRAEEGELYIPRATFIPNEAKWEGSKLHIGCAVFLPEDIRCWLEDTGRA